MSTGNPESKQVRQFFLPCALHGGRAGACTLSLHLWNNNEGRNDLIQHTHTQNILQVHVSFTLVKTNNQNMFATESSVVIKHTYAHSSTRQAIPTLIHADQMILYNNTSTLEYLTSDTST